MQRTLSTSALTYFAIESIIAITVARFAVVVVPEEQEKAVEFCRQATAGNPVYGHLAIYTAGGDRKVLNIVLAPLLQQQVVQGAYLFLKDVTETVVKNKKIHDSEQRLAAIVNTAIEGIQVLSLKVDLLDINGAQIERDESGRVAARLSGFRSPTRWDRIW